VGAVAQCASTARWVYANHGARACSRRSSAWRRQGRAQISMDDRGRALDNVFVERLWRTVKYEEVSLRETSTVWEAQQG